MTSYQLVVTVEGINPLLERVLDEALGETASRDDVNTVQAQLASIATQLLSWKACTCLLHVHVYCCACTAQGL